MRAHSNPHQPYTEDIGKSASGSGIDELDSGHQQVFVKTKFPSLMLPMPLSLM